MTNRYHLCHHLVLTFSHVVLAGLARTRFQMVDPTVDVLFSGVKIYHPMFVFLTLAVAVFVSYDVLLIDLNTWSWHTKMMIIILRTFYLN